MTLLSGRGLRARLGDNAVLAGVDFHLAAGEVVGLIGPNGAGKTTLLRILAGLLAPERGDLQLTGRPFAAVPRQERARLLAYLPQAGGAHWSLSVEALVMLGRLPHTTPFRAPGAADRAAAVAAMKRCDVLRLSDRPVDRLSGGERARVLLARALCTEPRVLLADEPVAGLDPAFQIDVLTTLTDLARSGAGIVVALHDLSLAARFCHRLVLLHDGGVAAEGAAAAVLAPEQLARCYGLSAVQGEAGGVPFILPLARVAR